MPENCGNSLENSLNYSLKNTLTLSRSDFYSVVDVQECRGPKLRELNLPRVTTVFVYIKEIFQADVAGKFKVIFPNPVFFQGTKRNKQLLESDSYHDTFDQVLFVRPDLSRWAKVGPPPGASTWS